MSAMVEKKISTWKESIKLGKKYTWKQFKKYKSTMLEEKAEKAR